MRHVFLTVRKSGCRGSAISNNFGDDVGCQAFSGDITVLTWSCSPCLACSVEAVVLIIGCGLERSSQPQHYGHS